MSDDLIEYIRNLLLSGNWTTNNSFELFKNLSIVVNNAKFENEGRELVIRTLEYEHLLNETEKEILYSLVRTVGLFPYLNPSVLSLQDLLAYEFHRPFNMNENIVFHSVQAQIYRKLLSGENVILSAPTSFGKSLIIDAMLASKKFDNIVIVVPTIALIDETRKRLSKFADYKVITHKDQQRDERNIFVMTQERALNYPDLENIDFFVIDEFYKLGLENDSDRSCLLNQIFYKLLMTGAQFYLLGPNIHSLAEDVDFKSAFIKTDFCTVVTETKYLKPEPTPEEATLQTCKNIEEQTLIYCRSPNSVQKLVEYFLNDGFGAYNPELEDAISWISDNYHPDWLLVRALKSGIGIHHGRLPRSISQYIVRAFNQGKIRFLVCTSTLIEGVNTSAKNVIIYDNKIAIKNLDFFTFNNIKGRSGRMFKHFIGRVFILEDAPKSELPTVDIPILSQSEGTPNKLLVQLKWEELTDESKEKVRHIYDQTILDINIIQENVGIDPDCQIHLAEQIQTNPDDYNCLHWKRITSPEYDALEQVSQIMWELIGKSDGSTRSNSVTSAKQLAYKINALSKNNDIKQMIQREIDNGNHPDKAIEEILDFIRNWAGFKIPKYLRALNGIQKYILGNMNYETSDLSIYADRIENMFMFPSVTALEEYGLPHQITLKIADKLSLNDGLDVVLEQLNSLSLEQVNLSDFEIEMLKEVVS